MHSQLLSSLLEVFPYMGFLLLLHYLRRSISSIPLYMTVGLYLLVGLMIGVSNFAVDSLMPGQGTPLGFGNMTLPGIAMLFIVYEFNGTQDAQRLILGLLIIVFSAFVYAQLLVSSYADLVFDMLSRHSSFAFQPIHLQRSLAIFVLIHLIILSCIPVVFQTLRNLKFPFALALFISLCLVLLCRDLDLTSPQSYINPKQFAKSWLIKLAHAFTITAITCFYIKLVNAKPVASHPRSGFFTEIFKHMQTTDRMRRSMQEWEERYQAVLDHSSELILLIDNKGKIINANNAALNTLDSLVENDDTTLDFFLYDKDMKPFTIDDLWDILDEEPKTVHSFTNMKLKKQDGTMVDLDFNLSRALIDNQAIAVFIARDVTEQHIQEKNRRELQEQLMHSQRLESVGMQAGGVAHDFNNMLHSIQGSADALAKCENLTQQQRSMIDNIENATKRAAALTAQLLGFARKGKFHVEKIDVKSMVEQTAELFKTNAKGISIKIILEPGLLSTSGDLSQLQQVLLNLLINAKDAVANKKDNPKIIIRAERARANTHEWEQRPDKDLKPEDFICLKVKDNGCGMANETRQRIFEPFFTTKDVGKGTGMGLAMVYGCVTNHKGWVSVASEPEQGTEFVICLPKA
jgi:PAS domain S-box-containing protein